MGQAMSCLYLIVLPVFGVFILSGQAEEPCELRTHRSELFVPLGERVVLNCTFTCSNKPQWESRLQKRNPQWGPNWASVEVLVDDWEKSELFCFQILSDGREKKDVTVVMAYALPSNVTIDLDQEMEEGKSHSVICTVYDVAPVKILQIQLLRANTVIQSKSFKDKGQKGKQTVNVTYDITASRMDNLQNFSCQATLDVATNISITSSSVTVTTYGQPDVPVVTVTPGPNIQEGDSFNVTCSSNGSPKPEYEWKVPTGADVTYTPNKSAVLVTRAGQVHNGVYTCEAKNVHGLVNGSRTVQVTTKGQPHNHIGAIVSPSLVFFIITPLILWKTRSQTSAPRD
ncbi:vascular cell adhesion protein 1-like [Anomaloglossus baeobatrachus]|uniref:vascular cell adhesion protein 1-like n=1 Tax=Anomaloglossus baeobatrachus TaxID=238106 RepID=UPI003F4FB6CE